MNTYEIRTEAATRSKARQSMTHTVQAHTEIEAIDLARELHIRRCGWNVPVWIESIRIKAED